MLQNLELTSYRRSHLAAREEAPVVSRRLVVCLLLLLTFGQGVWVWKRFAPSSWAMMPAAVAATRPEALPLPKGTTLPSRAALAKGTTAAKPAALARDEAASTETAVASVGQPDARPAPQAPRPTPAMASTPRAVRPSDVCLALSGALPEVAITLDATRRTEMLETLTQLQSAEEQARQILEQARATFSDEQIAEMQTLIKAEPYTSMTGADLTDRSTEVLTKIAEGTEAPPASAITRPVDGAARLTWEEVLRGALALENTSVMLSRSQAAQISAALSERTTVQKRLQLWRKQLLGQLTAEERARLEANLPAPAAGSDSTARALKDAIAALNAGAQP